MKSTRGTWGSCIKFALYVHVLKFNIDDFIAVKPATTCTTVLLWYNSAQLPESFFLVLKTEKLKRRYFHQDTKFSPCQMPLRLHYQLHQCTQGLL